MLEDISADGVVTVLKGTRHNLQDGDMVIFKEVVGMESSTKNINGSLFNIKVINPTQFSIGSCKDYGQYKRNGICKMIK